MDKNTVKGGLTATKHPQTAPRNTTDPTTNHRPETGVLGRGRGLVRAGGGAWSERGGGAKTPDV